MCYNHTGVTVRIKRLTSTESRDRLEGCRRFRSSLCRIPPKFINIFILYATFLSFRSIFLFPKSFLHTVMAASSRKVAGKGSIISRSVENEKLAELVKLAVAKAIKQAIPTLVEDVVAQLTSKMQALVDAQVAVFHGEMIAMQADISKCMDCIEKGKNRGPRWTASSLHLRIGLLYIMPRWRTRWLTWRTGRAETTYVCMGSLKTQRHHMLLLTCRMPFHGGFQGWFS